MSILFELVTLYEQTYSTMVNTQITLDQVVSFIRDENEFMVWFTSHEKTDAMVSAYESYRIGRELNNVFVLYDIYLTNSNNQNMTALKATSDVDQVSILYSMLSRYPMANQILTEVFIQYPDHAGIQIHMAKLNVWITELQVLHDNDDVDGFLGLFKKIKYQPTSRPLFDALLLAHPTNQDLLDQLEILNNDPNIQPVVPDPGM